MSGRRQKTQYQLALFAESRGEAPMASNEGTEPPVAGRETESRAEDEQLMEQVVSHANAQAASERVVSNRGAPGVDGLTVDELPDWLRSLVWKQWKRGKTRFRELVRRGVSAPEARRTAGSAHALWHISRTPALNMALPDACIAALGLPQLRMKDAASI